MDIMAIVRHIILGFFFGVFLMFIAELGFAAVNSQSIQEDILQIQDPVIARTASVASRDAAIHTP